MKTISLTGLLLVSSIVGIAQVNVFECQNSVIYPWHLDAEDQIYGPCLVFDESPYQTDVAEVKEVKATQSIIIDPDAPNEFFAGDFTTGEFVAEIEAAPFEVALMNYPDLHNDIEQYEKLEFGVKLPSTIQDAIDDFIDDETTPGAINPFLDWEIKVVATFDREDGQAYVDEQKIHGFYYESYTRDPDNTTTGQGSWTINQTNDYPFRIRFAPPVVDVWRCKVEIILPSETYTSPSFYFQVHSSPTNKGFVKVGSNKRYLTLGGETIYPICQNMTNDGYNNSVYGSEVAAPKAYKEFKEEITALNNAGLKYIRSFMHPHSMDIEFENIGNYHDRLHIAYEMDQIFELLEDNEMYVLLDFCWHQANFANPSDVYNNHWWDWSDQVKPNEYAYKTEFNLGPPEDFLTDTDARKYYKQKIRYIIARWGYSTSIMGLELMNEMDLFGQVSTTSNSYVNNSSVPGDVADWNEYMANYIKDDLKHTNHILTTNYAETPASTDGTWDISNFDINTRNFYKNEVDRFSEFYKGMNRPGTGAGIGEYFDLHDKPLFISETDGAPSTGGDIEVCQATIWETNLRVLPFTGVCGVSLWNRGKNANAARYYEMKNISNFMDGIDFDGGNWTSQNNTDDVTETRDDKHGELFCLRSGDKKRALGVVRNRTRNYHTAAHSPIVAPCDVAPSASTPPQDDVYDSFFSFDYSYGGLNERVYVRNMNNKKYYFDFIDLDNLSLISEEDDNAGTQYNRVLTEYPDLTYNNWIVGFEMLEENITSFRSGSVNSIGWHGTTAEVNVRDADMLNEEEVSVNLRPNPNNGHFTLTLEVVPEGGYVVEVYDLMGKRVWERAGITVSQLHLNIANYPDGIYLVKTYVNDTVYVEKIAKQ